MKYFLFAIGISLAAVHRESLWLILSTLFVILGITTKKALFRRKKQWTFLLVGVASIPINWFLLNNSMWIETIKKNTGRNFLYYVIFVLLLLMASFLEEIIIGLLLHVFMTKFQIKNKRKVLQSVCFIACFLCTVLAVNEEVIVYKNRTEAKTMLYKNFLKLDDMKLELPLEECTLKNSTPIIAQVVRGSELSIEEVTDISKAVVNVEMRYLGCADVPRVEIDNYESSFYNWKENKICISQKTVFNDYEQYLRLMLHMSYHVYQREQIEAVQVLRMTNPDYTRLRILMDAVEWESELKLYTDCELHERNLKMVKDAEEYAASYTEYLEAIESYWEQETVAL